MGQAIRTTKLLIDLGERTQGAANTRKRAYLEETAKILDAARADLMSPSSWLILRSSPSGSPMSPTEISKNGSGSFPPTSC